MIAPNDWNIRKCLLLSLTILIVLLGLIALDILGLDIPLLRPIFGFVCLSFLPGLLILRSLKIHGTGIGKCFLLSSGLSIAFIYFAGLFANQVLPIFGILKPITLLPIIVILTIFILILSAIAYLLDRETPLETIKVNISECCPYHYLLLILLLVFSLLGTQLVNHYNNNILLLINILLIGFIVALITLDILSENICAIAIIMMALSLFWSSSLISSQLFVHDIHYDYYIQYLVSQYGYWDSAMQINSNSCLSLVFLGPIYSTILNVDGVWVLKIINSYFCSLTPLALYYIYRQQFGYKAAFLGVFFFLAVPGGVFGAEGVAGREAPAKFFLCLLIMLLTSDRLNQINKSELTILFMAALSMTHYSTAYVFMLLTIIGWIIFHLLSTIPLGHRLSVLGTSTSLNSRFVAISLVFPLAWLIYSASGAPFSSFVLILNSLGERLIDIFEPMPSDNLIRAGLGYGFADASFFDKTFRTIQYLTQLFIFFGFFILLLRNQREFKAKPEFIALAIAAFIFLIASIVAPNYSSYFSFRRILNYCLIFISILCIIGGQFLIHILNSIVRFFFSLKISKIGYDSISRLIYYIKNDKSNKSSYLLIVSICVLIPYSLFTFGFVSAISGEYCGGYVLTDSIPIILGPYDLDRKVFNAQEIEAAYWVWNYLPKNRSIYADTFGGLLIYQRIGERVRLFRSSEELPEAIYIFLRKWNIEYNEIAVEVGKVHGVNINLISRPYYIIQINKKSLIYNNGGGKIYAPKD